MNLGTTFESIASLLITALLTVISSSALYVLEMGLRSIEETKKVAINKNWRQIIYGVIFGVLAILATVWGTSVQGVTLNTRDVAPLCAGLLFGPWAGIISGVLGGGFRYIFAYQYGEFSAIACSVSTVLAGIIGAVFRKYICENHPPRIFQGLFIGVVVETLHMLLVFMFRLNYVEQAFAVVKSCAIPMIITNSVCVMLACAIVALINRVKHKYQDKVKPKRSVSTIFQRWLLLSLVVAFIITSVVEFFVASGAAKTTINRTLETAITDVVSDINDAADKAMLTINKTVAYDVNADADVDLNMLLEKYNLSEINIVDDKGIITKSTNSAFIGFDMSSGSQSSEFLILLMGASSYVQSFQQITADSGVRMKYSGVKLEKGGFVQVGYNRDRYIAIMGEALKGSTKNRHVGEDGFIVIVNEEGLILSDRIGIQGMKLYETDFDFSVVRGANQVFNATIIDSDYYCMYQTTEGHYVFAAIPVSEATYDRDLNLYVTLMLEVLIFGGLYVLVYALVKKWLVDDIRKVNNDLAAIRDGKLDTIVDVRTSREFDELTTGLNEMIAALNHFIKEAEERINQELEFARKIQTSNLTSTFPQNDRFDIYAGMSTAKEVGGDFYDFYLIDESHLGILIADVSGKGIPAAMFMMTTKTLLRALSESGKDVADTLTKANNKICETNEAEMFVTVWAAVLNLKTGEIQFANAGHNPPVVKHADGTVEFIKSKVGLVLAGMEGINYQLNTAYLKPGDRIFLYTDGVTEATDANDQLYGDDRLLRAIKNAGDDISSKDFCKFIKQDVDQFVAEAPQFDDITMLSVRFTPTDKD